MISRTRRRTDPEPGQGRPTGKKCLRCGGTLETPWSDLCESCKLASFIPFRYDKGEAYQHTSDLEFGVYREDHPAQVGDYLADRKTGQMIYREVTLVVPGVFRRGSTGLFPVWVHRNATAHPPTGVEILDSPSAPRISSLAKTGKRPRF